MQNNPPALEAGPPRVTNLKKKISGSVPRSNPKLGLPAFVHCAP